MSKLISGTVAKSANVTPSTYFSITSSRPRQNLTVEHVLTKTALSERDRNVYRAYALEGRDIAEVARTFGISRNSVSQIKTRIDKRIVSVGRELIRGA